MKKKLGFALAFLTTLSLVVGFLTLKKTSFEDAFNYDSWDEDEKETLESI